jgi:YggT family protein
MAHQVVFRVLGALIFVYMLLLALRILITWFQSGSYGKAWEYLRRITDPYLNLFRGLKFLHIGFFDFTPIAAILVLVILQDILGSLSTYGSVTFGVILGITLNAAWHSFVWILLFLGVVSLIRLVGLYSGASLTHPIWNTVDMMVQPLARLAEKLVRRSLPYRQALVVVVVSILVIWLAGGWLVGRFVRLVFRLPF